MVGRPKTRIKKLRELNADVEQLLSRLINTAPQRASGDTPPQDAVGRLWHEAVDVIADAYVRLETVIEELDRKAQASAGVGLPSE